MQKNLVGNVFNSVLTFYTLNRNYRNIFILINLQKKICEMVDVLEKINSMI